MVKYPESLTEKPPPARRGFWRRIGRHLPGAAISLLLALFVGTLLWPYMVVTVPSGQVGVLWKRFTGPGIYCWCILARGTVLNPAELREEGLHIIWPWDRLFLYDLRLQATSQKYNAITKDGVSLTAEINIRYQLNHDSIAVFHKFIGPAYLTTLLGPEIGSDLRQVISQFTAQQVYVSRQEIEGKTRELAQQSLGGHLNQLVQPEASEQENAEYYKNTLQGSIRLLDTLALSIELPPAIVAAINRQTEQFYQIQEYKYRVAREAEESKRKQIEANGIASFQRTVSQGISDSYLRWRGIEATLALAQSQNTKIVIVGSGKDGLPIILGNVDSPPASSTSASRGTGDTTSPSGASPDPTDKTAPDLSSTTPDWTPDGSSKPPDTPGTGAPTASDKRPAAGSSTAPANPEKTPSSSTSLFDIESIFSRIYGALRPTGSDTSSGAGSKPKQ
jgi:regulator of protease activity HflC (stomatin/prohibitin superfamily)